MIPWVLVDRALVPGGLGELTLHQRDDEFSIRIANCELMNSRMHGSEEALAELACERIAARKRPRILIGGLGLGFTLAAVLRSVGREGVVVVAELVPAVVTWNRGPLAALAGRPLEDRRVTVRVDDVARIMAEEINGFDAILLDVDNGPEALTQLDNDRLYGANGLRSAHASLRPGGVLGIWSTGSNSSFARRLRRAGFTVDEIRVRARGTEGGPKHLIWLAQRGR